MATTDTSKSRVITLLALAAILVWTIVGYCYWRPALAVLDLQGWRQADTQTIAENLSKPGASILYPAVAWGGNGPGFVETELQIYTALVAGLMRAFGHGEWAGQLVSSLAIMATAMVVFFDLRRRHGWLPAVCALTAFLGTRSIVHLATSIQPDGLSLLAYAASWALFLQYRDSRKTSYLVLYSATLAFAMLVKPTAGQLGISCALLLLLTAPALFKRPSLWAAWAFPLVTVAIYLWHAHLVYVHYGNSFGLFKGGNDKVPTLAEVTSPYNLYLAARLTLVWGVGFVGSAALLVLAVRRRFTPEIWVLLVGNTLMSVAFIRITATMAGSHYVAPAALLGAEAIAVLVPSLVERWTKATSQLWRFAVVAAALVLAAQPIITARYRLRMSEVDPGAFTVLAAARALQPLVHPGDLVIVRAKIYDPRIFYIAHVRGWLANRDNPEVANVPDEIKKGARYLIDPVPSPTPTKLDDWLGQHARQVLPPGSPRIWDLRGAAPSSVPAAHAI